MPAPPPYPSTPGGSRPHYGSGYAAGFRGIGGDLLRTFPRLAPASADPPAIDPTAPGFASHGAHLLARIVSGPGGFRVAPCPVCHADAVLPRVGGWVPLRCEACGTEFVASDGSPPPSVSPPPTAFVTVKVTLPRRSPPPPPGLFVPCPACSSPQPVPHAADGRARLRCLGCGTDFAVTDGRVEPPPPPPPPTVWGRVRKWFSGE